MTAPLQDSTDRLDVAGKAILHFDTRYVLLASVIVVVVFAASLWFRKGRVPGRDEFISLVLKLAQVYSALVVAAVLLLTQPPAIAEIGTFQRQSAGLIAAIFLILAVVTDMASVWKKKDADGGATSARSAKATTSSVAGPIP